MPASLKGTRLYLAGPLFTVAERDFNSRIAEACIRREFEVWLPQDHEPREKTAKAIFQMDVQGILWSDIVVANMDGPDPDSGTCWEVGFAYGKRPIICYRTDFRNAEDFKGSAYNLMLSQSADRTFVVNALAGPEMATADNIAGAIYHHVSCLAYPGPNTRMIAEQFGGFERKPLRTENYRHSDK